MRSRPRLRAQVYDLLRDRTLVDRERGAALRDPALVTLRLTALGEDALAPAPRMADALRGAAAAADAGGEPNTARTLRLAAGPLLERCRGWLGAAIFAAVYGAAAPPRPREALCARGCVVTLNCEPRDDGCASGRGARHDLAAAAAAAAANGSGGDWAWASQSPRPHSFE